VTYGLTELYDKQSPRADVSGFGFELTLRLAREQGETDPPAFALNFLQNLARYAFDSGQAFSQGHTMDLNGPIALSRATKIEAVCFVTDPDLPVIETPHGEVQFIQIVEITRDE
jgi:suppressor of fused-like protein